MPCVTLFMRRKLFRTRREWSFFDREALTYEWNLNLSDIATIWRGGCIIRAKFLNRIVEAYRRNPALQNLLLDRYFTRAIKRSAAEMARSLSRQLSSSAYRSPRFLPRWRITTVIALLAFQRISCKRNAISLVRTLTNASISPASSTPNGSRQRKSLLKNRPNRKAHEPHQRASKHSSTSAVCQSARDEFAAASPQASAACRGRES